MSKYEYILSHILCGFVCVCMVLFASCSTTKSVPEGQYLLNKARVKVVDEKEVSGESMRKYLRQRQNSEVLGFWKMQLQIWGWQRGDSAKWINRQLRKISEPPEIFSSEAAEQSMQQLKLAMNNKGYYHNSVDTTMKIKKRKLNLTYLITAREPYTLRKYKIDLPNSDLTTFAERKRYIKDGMIFDTDQLDKERQRITTAMRYNGYYYFEKDLLAFMADSSLFTNQVDITLKMQDSYSQMPDSVREQVFTQFYVRNITFITTGEDGQVPDTVRNPRIEKKYPNYTFMVAGRRLLRERVLVNRFNIRPGDMYSERQVEKAYSELNTLGAVKYVNIAFRQVGDNQLDCYVVLSRAKKHTVSAELTGTFCGGDWGIAPGLTYVNRNIFGGSEELSLSAKGSYEWRQNGGRAIEAKADAALKFPNAVQVSAGYQFQLRPEEFRRTIVNAGLGYSIFTNRNRLRHTFNFIDISYVYLPWISDDFRKEFLQPTNILRYSYENHFIVDWAYSGNYSTYSRRNPLRSYTTLQYGVETAGNVLYGISKAFNLPQDEDGVYEIFKIPYSQYFKADFSWTYNQIIDKHNRLVYHAAVGVAVPFGNASSIPFEKRYFAGGANSVRGWTIRSLGPGGYRGSGNRIDYNNQSGDIKLDLNLEYRVKVVSFLHFAFFTDAGNIWTIRDYESQPYGVFRFDQFYKQIAWSYGAGIRLDFDFFVFRVDFGCKLHDPSRTNFDQKQWRTVQNGLCWKDDMTIHFAIGYPF